MPRTSMISRLIIVLCTARVARFQSTTETESCKEDQLEDFLLELKKTVDRRGNETPLQCAGHGGQLPQQASQQCRCNDTYIVEEMRRQQEEMKTELQHVKESLQQLSRQLQQQINNDSNAQIEDQRYTKRGTPTVAHTWSANGGVTAIALLNDQLFATRWGVAQVSVFNATTMQPKRELTFAGLSTSLHGLATCSTYNYLYISDYDNHCIHRVHFSTSGEDTLIKWNVATCPCGLSVNGARNILVAYNGQHKVQEYTPTGTLVREISDSNRLFQAIELSSGMLAVSRHGPTVHGVFTVSIATQVKHSYGNQEGSGAGQMAAPHCLAVDNFGYIIVSDVFNNRLLVMNPCLTDARQLPLPITTALQQPVPIVLDQSRGRLYVGERAAQTGQHRLLVFDNVTNIGALFDN